MTVQLKYFFLIYKIRPLYVRLYHGALVALLKAILLFGSCPYSLITDSHVMTLFLAFYMANRSFSIESKISSSKDSSMSSSVKVS